MGNQRIGDYDLIEPLNRGGICTVYRAIDLRDGTPTALKIFKIPDKFQGSKRQEIVNRLQRQIEVAITLEHPNVMRLMEAFEQDDFHCQAFELAEGISVQEVLCQERTLTVSRASNIAIQVADALDELNSQGIIHRRVSPENILILRDGSAKLTCFSITELIAELDMMEAQASGDTSGVVDPVYNLRTDRFSMACALYEMVSGHKPFAGDLQESGGYPPRPAGVPDYVAAILRKSLAKNPDSRYRSAGEMARDLKDQHAPPAPRETAVATQMCFYHPDRRMMAACAICGRNLCQDCSRYIRDKMMCRVCAVKFTRKNDSILFSALCGLFGSLSLMVGYIPRPITVPLAFICGFLAVFRKEELKSVLYTGLISACIGLMYWMLLRNFN